MEIMEDRKYILEFFGFYMRYFVSKDCSHYVNSIDSITWHYLVGLLPSFIKQRLFSTCATLFLNVTTVALVAEGHLISFFYSFFHFGTVDKMLL